VAFPGLCGRAGVELGRRNASQRLLMAKACVPGPLAVWSRPPSGQLGSPGANGQYADGSEFSLLRKQFGEPAPTPGTKPSKATTKPYTRHILGIDSGVQSHPKATTKPSTVECRATPKPPQGSTKATLRLHQSHTKATPKPSAVPVQQKSRNIVPAFLPHSTLRTTLNLHLMPRRRFAPVSHTRSDYCVFASSTSIT
jgi:hypothetical protein